MRWARLSAVTQVPGVHGITESETRMTLVRGFIMLAVLKITRRFLSQSIHTILHRATLPASFSKRKVKAEFDSRIIHEKADTYLRVFALHRDLSLTLPLNQKTTFFLSLAAQLSPEQLRLHEVCTVLVIIGGLGIH
jgi:hypothetical protein